MQLSETDWKRLREICCQTAQGGAPIESDRWPFFGDLWIEPYQRFAPQNTVVLRAAASSSSSSIMGYCTTTLRTPAHERYVRWVHTPRLMLRLFLGRYAANADTRKFLSQWIGRAPDADDYFGREWMAAVKRTYPSHLHINLMPEVRGRGRGAALLEQACGVLKQQGSTGVYVICGTQAVSFYRKTGFQELKSVDVTPGKPITLLGRKF